MTKDYRKEIWVKTFISYISTGFAAQQASKRADEALKEFDGHWPKERTSSQHATAENIWLNAYEKYISNGMAPTVASEKAGHAKEAYVAYMSHPNKQEQPA